jgi:hypothetical protein
MYPDVFIWIFDIDIPTAFYHSLRNSLNDDIRITWLDLGIDPPIILILKDVFNFFDS